MRFFYEISEKAQKSLITAIMSQLQRLKEIETKKFGVTFQSGDGIFERR
jgi:hypothetical protein